MLYHHNPHQWPWDQGHGLWNITLKFLVKVFFFLLLWKQLRQIGGWTSASLVTLSCVPWSEGHYDPFFTVHWFCLISWRLFNVWTSYFGIISQYDLTCDLKINVGYYGLYFMVQWFCLISWRLFDVWTSYFGIMSQYDRTFDLKINIGHCDLYFMVQWFYLISWRLFHIWTPYFGIMSLYDLYFMVQWFCLISWKLFSGWTSYFGIMSQYDPTYDLQIFVGHFDLYFMVHWICPVSWRLFDVWTSYVRIMSQYDTTFDLEINVGHCDLYFMIQWCCFIIRSDYESVWHDIWPWNKCRSLWPIFHDPVMLLYILIVFDEWMPFFWKMSQCNTTFDLKTNLGHSDLNLIVQWFPSLIFFCAEKHFSFIGKARFRRATLSCDSSYCVYRYRVRVPI